MHKTLPPISFNLLRFHWPFSDPIKPPHDVISQSEVVVAVLAPLMFVPRWKTLWCDFAIAYRNIHMPLFMSPIHSSDAISLSHPMRHRYHKSFLSNSPFYRISPVFTAYFSFTAKPCFYSKTFLLLQIIYLLQIASFMHFRNHKPLSHRSIICISRRVIAIVQAFLPFHPRCNRRCDIAISHC